MRPNKIWANLAVKDVERTRKFYTTLGFKTNEEQEGKDLTSFKIGENNFVVHFFLDDVLEKFLREKTANLEQGNEIIFTLWAESREEADTWAQEVRNAGGTIFIEPEAFGENYYGFGFSDPDGHKWNVFHM
jgi:predicted lactoylglutathione lyase